MKEIQPINVWSDGQVFQANYFTLVSTRDNLSTKAIFDYQLLLVVEAGQTILTRGELIMDGTDYQDWGTNTDVNLAAYIWATGKLNLTLV